MKKLFTKTFKKAALLASAACVLGVNANAATFTAIASGNFSSSSTWSGGIVPPLSILSDIIIIPSGITITLDQNQIMAGATSSLTVDGTLTGNAGNYMVMTDGVINGNGTIDIDSFAADFTSGFAFDGSFTTNKFTSMDANITSAATVQVDETLYLTSGVMTMANGSLSLSNNATIVVKDGTMTVTGGTANLTNTYNVRYDAGTNTSVNGGIELTGSGLNDIEINLGSSNSLMLSSDLTVDGELMLTSGNLTLNNNNLTFTTNGDVSASGSGRIISSSNSDITINSSNGLTGGLRLGSSSNTVDDLTINLGNNSGEVMLNSDVVVTGVLSLQSGNINAGANSVILQTGSGATISGGSMSSYVITTMGGSLDIDVAGSGSQMFYIGTNNNYAPVMVTNNSSSMNTIKAGVDAGVMANGTSGSSVSATQPAVDATWFIENSVSANADVDLEVMWSNSMEVNSFDRTKAYISHYTNAAWDVSASASATTATNGMFSLTRSNITSFSPFAVYDENTALSVSDLAGANEIGLKVYPNPATSNLHIENKAQEDLNVTIFNVSGQQVKATVISGAHNTLDVSGLQDGMYYIKMQNANTNATASFVKQ